MKLILNITIPTEHAHLWENSGIPYTMLDYRNGITAVSVNTDAITIPVQLIKESHATGYAAESFLSELTSTMVEFFTDGIFTDSDSFQISIDQFAHATCEDGVITVTLKNNGKLVNETEWNWDGPDFSKPVEEFNLPDELLLEEDDDFSDLDDVLLPDDHFNELDEPEPSRCKLLMYIIILGQKFALVKVEELTRTWFATIPVTEFTSDSIHAVLYYRHCGDSTPGEALRNRKLNTLYERYKAIEENADAAFHRAFNEVYPIPVLKGE